MGWVEYVFRVRGEVVRFFSYYFSDHSHHGPLIEGFEFLGISLEESSLLTAPFSLEEIEAAVALSDGNKRQ